MKFRLGIIFLVINFLVGCNKANMAIEKLIKSTWALKNFYVDDTDKTDSLLNISKTWYYSFAEDPDRIYGNMINASYAFMENNAKEMMIKANSDTLSAGPFLATNIWITWDFNYNKLCRDNEIWLTTNYNGKKYESHFAEW